MGTKDSENETLVFSFEVFASFVVTHSSFGSVDRQRCLWKRLLRLVAMTVGERSRRNLVAVRKESPVPIARLDLENHLRNRTVQHGRNARNHAGTKAKSLARKGGRDS